MGWCYGRRRHSRRWSHGPTSVRRSVEPSSILMVHAICRNCSFGNDGGCAGSGVLLLPTVKKAARGSAVTRGLAFVVAHDISLRSFARPAIEVELTGRGCHSLTGAPL